jgi:hypothetical protein
LTELLIVALEDNGIVLIDFTHTHFAASRIAKSDVVFESFVISKTFDDLLAR